MKYFSMYLHYITLVSRVDFFMTMSFLRKQPQKKFSAREHYENF